MKQFGIALVLALGLALAACGGGNSSNPGTVTGNWTATLTGTPTFTFTTSLSQSNGTTVVTVSNLNFSSNNCFTSGGTQTGSFVLSGNFNGNITGSYQMTITSGTPSGNTLTLEGTVNDNSIAGTWNLTGSADCTGSGTFTMTKM
jgi:hypothetical protein